MTIEAFIQQLSQARPSHAYNMYAHDAGNDAMVRRKNLALYLESMLSREPEIMLVGEAPGYQGSRQTGIPFTSEHIMLNGFRDHDVFGGDKGYEKISLHPEKVWKEPSSTIMWGEVLQMPVLPLIWSAFPFHPHEAGDQYTNRAPTVTELEEGRGYIEALLRMFPIRSVVAVGNQAQKSLEKLGLVEKGYVVDKVRHPSHGGKRDFAQGLKRIINNSTGF